MALWQTSEDLNQFSRWVNIARDQYWSQIWIKTIMHIVPLPCYNLLIRLQKFELKFEPLHVLWQSLDQAFQEGNQTFWVLSNGQALWAALRHKVWCFVDLRQWLRRSKWWPVLRQGQISTSIDEHSHFRWLCIKARKQYLAWVWIDHNKCLQPELLKIKSNVRMHWLKPLNEYEQSASENDHPLCCGPL